MKEKSVGLPPSAAAPPTNMLAYHFCERIAKQVSPWEYIVTQADVDEARAAWLALEKLNAAASREGGSSPDRPTHAPSDEPESHMPFNRWPWVVYTTAYGLRIRHEVTGTELDMYEAATKLSDYDFERRAAALAGTAAADAREWVERLIAKIEAQTQVWGYHEDPTWHVRMAITDIRAELTHAASASIEERAKALYAVLYADSGSLRTPNWEALAEVHRERFRRAALAVGAPADQDKIDAAFRAATEALTTVQALGGHWEPDQLAYAAVKAALVVLGIASTDNPAFLKRYGAGAPAAPAPDQPQEFEPPGWACDAFLRTISAEAKMAARMHGKPGALPPSWTMVDAVLYWWETDGRARWSAAEPPPQGYTIEDFAEAVEDAAKFADELLTRDMELDSEDEATTSTGRVARMAATYLRGLRAAPPPSEAPRGTEEQTDA